MEPSPVKEFTLSTGLQEGVITGYHQVPKHDSQLRDIRHPFGNQACLYSLPLWLQYIHLVKTQLQTSNCRAFKELVWWGIRDVIAHLRTFNGTTLLWLIAEICHSSVASCFVRHSLLNLSVIRDWLVSVLLKLIARLEYIYRKSIGGFYKSHHFATWKDLWLLACAIFGGGSFSG